MEKHSKLVFMQAHESRQLKQIDQFPLRSLSNFINGYIISIIHHKQLAKQQKATTRFHFLVNTVADIHNKAETTPEIALHMKAYSLSILFGSR